MPLPQDVRTVFQGALFLFTVLTALYVARGFFLPVVLAIVLKLLLQPLVRLLERLRVPRVAGALLAIGVVVATLAGLGMLLSSPAASWAEQLPDAWTKLQDSFALLREPAQRAQTALGHIGINFEAKAIGGMLQPAAWITAVFSSTGNVASTLLQVLLILFYLLVFGETFLRRAVEILPRFRDKREVVELSLHIERDLSSYLVTATVINAVVGVATALVMWATGVPGPALWGTLAFCVNYVPILGPICAIVLFAAVGVVAKGAVWLALLPAGLYLIIHLVEGEIITPMVMARRFTINPVAVILSLIFWSWMWGVPGMVLAVPMLAIIKIVCDRLRPLRAFGHLLES
ncbi:MAG: AI-2E family transporter [Alphaproteobacteria bacterium]|nr:AI-2E family transporter [Alphaproteobacteria bacterium]